MQRNETKKLIEGNILARISTTEVSLVLVCSYYIFHLLNYENVCLKMLDYRCVREKDKIEYAEFMQVRVFRNLKQLFVSLNMELEMLLINNIAIIWFMINFRNSYLPIYVFITS